MTRSALRTIAAIVLVTAATPVQAEERAANGLTAPSKAVADAWAREAQERREFDGREGSKATTILYGSYGALQGLDMYSTVVARNRGAREVNPLMDGGYAQAGMFKALMGAGTFAGVKVLEKKNKKAAIVTLVVMNAVTATVAVNNFRNARRLK